MSHKQNYASFLWNFKPTQLRPGDRIVYSHILHGVKIFRIFKRKGEKISAAITFNGPIGMTGDVEIELKSEDDFESFCTLLASAVSPNFFVEKPADFHPDGWVREVRSLDCPIRFHTRL
jgi:hypothetical protein